MFPTPTLNQYHHTDLDRLLERREEVKAKGYNGNGFGLTLEQKIMLDEREKEQEKMWPTPTAHLDSHYPDHSPNADKRHSRGLASEVEHREQERMWPTPQASDVRNGWAQKWEEAMNEPDKKRSRDLRDAVVADPGMWPTPTTRDHKGGYQGGRIRNGKVSMDTLDVAVQATSNQEKTQAVLAPEFVEVLMGYPKGWTLLTAGSTEHGKMESVEPPSIEKEESHA